VDIDHLCRFLRFRKQTACPTLKAGPSAGQDRAGYGVQPTGHDHLRRMAKVELKRFRQITIIARRKLDLDIAELDVPLANNPFIEIMICRQKIHFTITKYPMQ
jgi:hypothetical protein